MAAKNPAIKRIHADLRELQSNPSPNATAQPTEDNLFDWHFTLRGPPGTDFEVSLVRKSSAAVVRSSTPVLWWVVAGAGSSARNSLRTCMQQGLWREMRALRCALSVREMSCLAPAQLRVVRRPSLHNSRSNR
jgi:hypothetical protein